MADTKVDAKVDEVLCDISGCLRDGTEPTGRYKKLRLCADHIKASSWDASMTSREINYLNRIDELRHQIEVERAATTSLVALDTIAAPSTPLTETFTPQAGEVWRNPRGDCYRIEYIDHPGHAVVLGPDGRLDGARLRLMTPENGWTKVS